MHVVEYIVCDLVKQIQENPYYQYFIGLESFQHMFICFHVLLPLLRSAS